MAMDKKGLTKLSEEAHELGIELHQLGKLAMKKSAYFDVDAHPDGTNLKQAIQEEMGDVLASMKFVAKSLGIDWDAVKERSQVKIAKYESWKKSKD